MDEKDGEANSQRSYRSLVATAISTKPAITNAVILSMSKRILKEVNQLTDAHYCEMM